MATERLTADEIAAFEEGLSRNPEYMPRVSPGLVRIIIDTAKREAAQAKELATVTAALTDAELQAAADGPFVSPPPTGPVVRFGPVAERDKIIRTLTAEVDMRRGHHSFDSVASRLAIYDATDTLDLTAWRTL